MEGKPLDNKETMEQITKLVEEEWTPQQWKEGIEYASFRDSICNNTNHFVRFLI